MGVATLKKNTLWNLAGSAAPMVIGLVSIPILITKIGVERFGILSLIWSLIGYFSIFDFGIGRALTFQVAQLLTRDEKKEVAGVINSGLKFMLVSGLVGGLILFGVAKPLGYDWLNANPAIHQETYIAILIAAAAIPLTTYTTGLKGILEGYEAFREVNMLKFVLGVMNFGFPIVAALVFGPSLIYIVYSLLLARLIVFVWHLIAVNRYISVQQVFAAGNQKKGNQYQLLSFGAWMTLSNIVSPLMVTADRFVISYLLGASVVAYYTVPFDFVIRLLVIPAALTGVLFPRFSKLIATNRSDAQYLFRKSHRIILGIMLAISVSLAVFSHFGLEIWINKEMADRSWIILAILSVGLLFNSLAQLPHAMIQASGKVQLTSVIHLFEFVLYVGLLFLSIHILGIIGAALAFVIRVVIDFFLLRHFSNKVIQEHG